ncbi:MAG: ATP-dependent sacrificial sulfur transferase LarE [Ruminococcus sp.]|nr:ATP-dependent sacrificial sulfur transferase LarE [Ruminococcus sp.]
MYEDKYSALISSLKALGSAAAAFSGGVDSTLLLYAAREALGDRAAAVTALTPAFPAEEAEEAAALCKRLGVRQLTVSFGIGDIPRFAENPPDRCYHCKKALFAGLKAAALREGFMQLAEGSNTDDAGDYRPGARAVAELGVISPLKAAGLSKAEVRQLSKQLGLPTWDKPSYACLATRIPYGDRITEERLLTVGKAEQLLHRLGFLRSRVRLHGQTARIEIMPGQFEEIMQPEVRESIVAGLKALGLAYVSLDLTGYRTGSMNEIL